MKIYTKPEIEIKQFANDDAVLLETSNNVVNKTSLEQKAVKWGNL